MISTRVAILEDSGRRKIHGRCRFAEECAAGSGSPEVIRASARGCLKTVISVFFGDSVDH